MVPTIPTPHPELENAKGPARSPEPNEALIMFAVDLKSLKFWHWIEQVYFSLKPDTAHDFLLV